VNARTRLLFIGLVAGMAGCRTSPTAPSLVDLQRAQASWTAHHLTRYAYRYMTTGFFNALDGKAIRVVVLADTVRSAQVVATNDSLPVASAMLPTIDALFALAIAARADGTLVAAQFDSVFAYPTRLEIAGHPDASGVIVASHIELLP
jgi:hypothetical protein